MINNSDNDSDNDNNNSYTHNKNSNGILITCVIFFGAHQSNFCTTNIIEVVMSTVDEGCCFCCLYFILNVAMLFMCFRISDEMG